MKMRDCSIDLHEKIGLLSRQLEGKDAMIKHLLEKIESMESSIQNLEETISRQHETIIKYEKKLFGTSSERTHEDKIDSDDDGDSKQSKKEFIPSKRKPYKHPHKREYRSLPDDKIIELRPDNSLIKGARLVKVSKTYRFYYIPGRLCKVRYDRYIYSKEGKLITPPLPYVPEGLEKRYAEPNLIAQLLVNKYLYHLPVERQLRILNRGDIKIPKTTLHDWISAGIDSLDGIYEAIKEKVLSDDLIHVDETTMPVVDASEHHTRKGYDWGFISPTNNIMFFTRGSGSRRADILDEQIQNFKGRYIHSDGYAAYQNVASRTGKRLINIPCLSHIRRKFVESQLFDKEKSEEALHLINMIFFNEKKYKDEKLAKNQIEYRRELELRPLLNDLKKWLEKERIQKQAYKESSLGKAIDYAYTHVDKLYHLIGNGLLSASNNLAERTMRSHAMGRNSYLFCQNEESAMRTCKIYSIIESCKLSKIDPYEYLTFVLSKKPMPGETWDALLPCNVDINIMRNKNM